MDRTWISKDKRSKEYEDGVERFITFAIQNSTNKTPLNVHAYSVVI